MSKFIDKLKQISQMESKPMGFRTGQEASQRPKPILAVSVAHLDNLADYIAEADAGLLHISNLKSGIKTLQKMGQIVPDVPWGGWLKNIGPEEIKQGADIGCDFLIFSAANTPLILVENDKVGKILEIKASLSEGILRTVNELPIDAVLITSEQEEEDSLTWHHLMIARRLAALSAKPLLLSIPLGVTAAELQALWDTGVDGLIVEVGAKQPLNKLRELHQAINTLTSPPKHKWKRREALLPPFSRGEDTLTEEEE